MDHSFFVACHPDDSILFRGNGLFTDVHTPGVEVVHVIADAGDAGRTDGWWQQREQACVAALNVTVGDPTIISEKIAIGLKTVQRYRAANWYCYCLRLPDGGVDGQGYNGHGSLTKLRSGAIRTLATVDGALSYTWSDVVAMLRGIVQAHRGNGERPWINTSDPDSARNPGDHPDHYAVAAAVDEAAVAEGLNRAYWVSYDTQSRPVNLSGIELARKRFLFEQYGAGTGGPNEQEWGWWGQREAWRTIPAT